MIRVQAVKKIYNPGEPTEVRAIDGITTAFEDGEYVVLTGASGSGKSTLLNLIGALDSLSGGDIVINGVNLSTLDDKALSRMRLEHIGFVFQAYNLVPVLSVRENIGFVMQMLGIEKETIAKRIGELADILQISELLDKMPHEISGGQQQRVAVARAVASRPSIILADEPTANLDSKNSEHLMAMMKGLNEREGITVIFASHDDYVVKQAKRIIVMEDGKVIDDR